MFPSEIPLLNTKSWHLQLFPTFLVLIQFHSFVLTHYSMFSLYIIRKDMMNILIKRQQLKRDENVRSRPPIGLQWTTRNPHSTGQAVAGQNNIIHRYSKIVELMARIVNENKNWKRKYTCTFWNPGPLSYLQLLNAIFTLY